MNHMPLLNRRRFLQGAGVALSIPVFESNSAGDSVAEKLPRRLVCVGNHLGFYPGNFSRKRPAKTIRRLRRLSRSRNIAPN